MRSDLHSVSPHNTRRGRLDGWKTLWAGLALWTVLAATGAAEDSSALAAAAARVSADISYLASDELAGRGVGTEGIARAGEYIAGRFQELGFKTDQFDGTPFQNFGIPGPIVMGPEEANSLTFTRQGQPLDKLKLGVDYTPLSLGSSGTFQGQVAFAGYGITAPEYNYDDYAGFDAEGKVIIALRKEPQQTDANSVFEGTQNSQYAFFTSKEMNAAVHKAAALILINDAGTVAAAEVKLKEDLQRAQQALEQLTQATPPEAAEERMRWESRVRIATQNVDEIKRKISIGGDAILTVEAAGRALTRQSVPTYFCTRALASRLIEASSGRSLVELEKAIDADGKPHSLVLDNLEATGQTSLQPSSTPVRNVIALLPGAGELASEYVVIGAHYDHVGMGGMGSLAPGTIAVHNGADDNASGTVTMLEVAKQLSKNQSENRRSIIFMAFTAEESGLLGSAHYVRNPRWPLEKTVAMINLDMVGRLLGDELTVYGTGTATEFPAMIDRINEQYQFRIVKVPQGRGASDHANFYDAKIPVFHFFTGLHNEYHRPNDDADLINVPGVVRISRFVTDVAKEIAESPNRPQLLDVKGSAAPRNQSGAGRAMLGIRLERSPELPATVLAVTEGGAAALAGLQAGDVLVSINGEAVSNVGEFRGAMAKLKPSQTVKVEFQRGKETKSADVTLGQ